MSSAIPPAVAQVFQARNDANAQKLNMAVIGKQLDNQRMMGDALNQLLEQTKLAQQQIQNGYLDVRV